jgi:hypothetical protein
MNKCPNAKSTLKNLSQIQNQLPESSVTSVAHDLPPIDVQTSGNALVIFIDPADEASKKMLIAPEPG